MKQKIIAATFLFILLTAGCRNLMGDPLIGKWKEVGKKDVLEIMADGTFVQTGGMMSVTGKWEHLSDGRYKLEAIIFGVTTAEIFTVEIEDEKATFTDSTGKITKSERQKGA